VRVEPPATSTLFTTALLSGAFSSFVASRAEFELLNRKPAMSTLFTTALLSGAFAALVAVAVTRLIELLGGTLGGVLASMPTTVIPASIGFALVAGLPARGAPPPDAQPGLLLAACFTVPSGMLVSALFLTVWRYVPPLLPPTWPLRRALPFMVLFSLSVWAACAAASISISRAAGNPVAYGAICFALHAAIALRVTWSHKSAPKGAASVPWRALALRGALAGLAIFFSVLLSAAGDGGVMGGMASTFPAIFLSIQVALWASSGGAVQGGAVGPVMLGAVSVPTFAMLFAGLAPLWGIAAAAAVSWVGAVLLVSAPAFAYLRWRGGCAGAAAGGGADGAVAAQAPAKGARAAEEAPAEEARADAPAPVAP
jgi:hypothetical protein